MAPPLKRRFLRRGYHPALGYYCGFSIQRNADEESVPLAMDAADAVRMFDAGEEFGWVERDEQSERIAGRFIAGFATDEARRAVSAERLAQFRARLPSVVVPFAELKAAGLAR